MKDRPECPLCVTRTCANCFFKDVALNRLWLDKHLPNGECRRCGAVRAAVTETPVRHTNKDIHEGHLDAYAEHLLTKPPKLIDRGAERIAAVNELLDMIDDPVFDLYRERRWLASGIYRERSHGSDVLTPREIEAMNAMTGKMLRFEEIIRTWTDRHPVLALDGFTVLGDNDADGDSVFLYCSRCPKTDDLSPGVFIERFLTDPWNTSPDVATLADLFAAARDHDAEVHRG